MAKRSVKPFLHVVLKADFITASTTASYLQETPRSSEVHYLFLTNALKRITKPKHSNIACGANTNARLCNRLLKVISITGFG